MEKARQVNQYVCEKCDKPTTTINACDGVTPFLVRCRRLCCDGMARSSFYRVPQDLRPTHEWYRPEPHELEGLGEETREHVRNGGLLLRKLDAIGLERHGYHIRRG